jgi:hypothetical protein
MSRFGAAPALLGLRMATIAVSQRRRPKGIRLASRETVYKLYTFWAPKLRTEATYFEHSCLFFEKFARWHDSRWVFCG